MITMIFDFFGLWPRSRQEKAEGQPHAPVTQQDHAPVTQQDHVLTPEKVGDVLVGHNGETDRFVFNDPSLSSDSRMMTVAQVEGREAQYLEDYIVARAPVRIEDFNPDEGDVIDFSALGTDLSFSGSTPQSHAVWSGERHYASLDYTLQVDLDGNPRTTEMWVLLAPTAADMYEAEWDWNNDGVIDMSGYEAKQTKTMTDDMFVFA